MQHKVFFFKSFPQNSAEKTALHTGAAGRLLDINPRWLSADLSACGSFCTGHA